MNQGAELNACVPLTSCCRSTGQAETAAVSEFSATVGAAPAGTAEVLNRPATSSSTATARPAREPIKLNATRTRLTP